MFIFCSRRPFVFALLESECLFQLERTKMAAIKLPTMKKPDLPIPANVRFDGYKGFVMVDGSDGRSFRSTLCGACFGGGRYVSDRRVEIGSR